MFEAGGKTAVAERAVCKFCNLRTEVDYNTKSTEYAWCTYYTNCF